MMSYTAERFCDWATSAWMSSGEASASMLYVTLMPLKPLRMSLSMPRMPRTSIVAFDRRRDLAQLDVAVLGDGRHAGGQAAGQADEHVLDRRRAVVLGGEELGMVDVEGVRRAVALLVAEAEEALDVRVAVRAVHPLARRSPHELRGLGRRRSSASRAPSSASTLTPLLTGVSVADIGHPPCGEASREVIPGSRDDSSSPPTRNGLSSGLRTRGAASGVGDRATDGHLAPDLGIEGLAELRRRPARRARRALW